MFSEGTFWVEQRRFTLRHLRDFGFGKKSVENVIWEEAEDLFETVFRKNDIVQVRLHCLLKDHDVIDCIYYGSKENRNIFVR